MNIGQMHIAFQLELDKTNRLEYPDFLPEERDYWLNRSILDTVRQRATGRNATATSAEETEKRRDDLRNITKNYSVSVFTQNSNNKPNGYFVTLPDDYFYTLNEEVLYSHNDCHGNTVTDRKPVRPTTHDRYNKVIYDPFNKPYEEEILSLPYEGNTNELLFEPGDTPITYYLRYYRMPAEVSLSGGVDCDLSWHLHSEIVVNAVNLAIENIESPRVITQGTQVAKNE